MASRVIFEGQSGRASLGLSAMTLSRHSLTVRVKEDFGMSKWVDSCSRAISRTIFCVRVVAMRSLAVASALRFTPRAFDRAFATALGLAWRAAAAASDLCAFLRFPGAAAPLQAHKAKNQRSRNSYAGFRPRQSPLRPKPCFNFRMSSQICQLHLVTLFNLAPNCADACNTILRMP